MEKIRKTGNLIGQKNQSELRCRDFHERLSFEPSVVSDTGENIDANDQQSHYGQYQITI
ncbi:hypothetical protein [uncultured Croceitalea sp.]|uniref:hypothetical protein n=1 Tax=uncultured Croceitalea sp. TaxID=1798908 RepID=UPI003305BCCE